MLISADLPAKLAVLIPKKLIENIFIRVKKKMKAAHRLLLKHESSLLLPSLLYIIL